ncbi:hypothetical protein BZG36_03190 [Bifiguratus adelaidae]|uniref:Vacuolar import and degradation protein-domain-containing protein n=1 Tax=Bifiguratus adelaidae TaxID=1938954 RepID=A0A261XYK3_9FUNG|nr:hypothetical protein BZG36_03190 [Bifiguratus adelaidae]
MPGIEHFSFLRPGRSFLGVQNLVNVPYDNCGSYNISSSSQRPRGGLGLQRFGRFRMRSPRHSPSVLSTTNSASNALLQQHLRTISMSPSMSLGYQHRRRHPPSPQPPTSSTSFQSSQPDFDPFSESSQPHQSNPSSPLTRLMETYAEVPTHPGIGWLSNMTRVRSESNHSPNAGARENSIGRRLGRGREEEWDVRVTIHSVDYDNGSVTGLMEALNVPATTAPVITFWEGEIIDFRNHDLWTNAYEATKDVDTRHWREFEAFWGEPALNDSCDQLAPVTQYSAMQSDMLVDKRPPEGPFVGPDQPLDRSDDDFVLRSWRGIGEALSEDQWDYTGDMQDDDQQNFDDRLRKGELGVLKAARENQFSDWLKRNYILMRWKEKCFVNVSAQESGLTIAGFYYVCLRLRDGALEGYYYDPQSTPYQRLQLKPQVDGNGYSFASYQFA